jgi:hypothetical protein
MTYERYKTGTFRVSVFLTILLWELVFLAAFYSSSHVYIFGVDMGRTMDVIITAPIFIWTTYFFSLWIAKGFIGK